MKKIIKISESELLKIIEGIINEQSVVGAGTTPPTPFMPNRTQAPKKENINPKNLKLGDGGKNSPEKIQDVNQLQQKLIDLKLLNIAKPTGYFGPQTEKALQQYNSGGGSESAAQPQSGFILIWAFPEYEPRVDGKGKVAQLFGSVIRFVSGGGSEGTYGKLGHGGCIIVDATGNSTLFEFGRYPGHKEGFGKVLSHRLGRIAKIQNNQLMNPEKIAEIGRSKTYPPGPQMKMSVAVVKLPNPANAIQYASKKEREYTALDFSIGDDANCATYARDVANAGGVKVPTFCFPDAVGVVKSFRKMADKVFEI